MTWNLFSNKKEEKAAKEMHEEPTLPGGKKNRATPKRKEAQAAAYTPLIPDPKDRKARRKVERQRIRERENREYAAMESGNVAEMPKAERNPMRVYMRAWIDARFNVSEFFIPAAIILLVGSLVFSAYSTVVGFVLAMAMYIYMFAVIIDLIVMWITLKRSMIKHHKWDGDKSKLRETHAMTYAISRALQIRRMRVPRPTEKKRGNWPK